MKTNYLSYLLSLYILLTLAACNTGQTNEESSSQRARTAKSQDFFPVSAWYSGGKARAPMLSKITTESREEWGKDLAQIKSLGFNTVRTWVEWTHCEPKEGEFNFDNLEMLCELAQEQGLKVFIQMYGESAPDWVGNKFPNGLLEAHSGDKIEPQSAPGYCVDHPGVRHAFEDFYNKTAKVAAKYPNVYGWDLWSEPHVVQWGRPGWIPDADYCYCPSSVLRFQDWLKQKYPSLAELNEAWYRTFVSWSDVEPPRFNTILSYTDYIDWKNFSFQKTAEDLRLRYEAVKKVNPNWILTSHASPPSIFKSPQGAGAEDDFLMAEMVDHYGISQYPKHNQPGDWIRSNFLTNADFSYSANKKNGGYYVGEFQAGFGTVGLRIGDEVTPADHRIWFWLSMATGARGINVYAYYPMSSGYESGGYGLINLDGTLTDRAASIGRIAQIVDENQDLFLDSRPVAAEIAIVYNPLAQMVGGRSGGSWYGTSDAPSHSKSLIGYYRIFADNNVPVDFIHRKDLGDLDLTQYKLILLAYPLMFTQAAAETLKSYVENGGSLVAEARLAWNDDRGYATEIIPGMGFSEVFGIRESKVEVKSTVLLNIVENAHPLFRSFSGRILTGKHFAESLELLPNSNAQVLATLDDGSPAMTASEYGSGQALFIGSFLENRVHSSFQGAERSAAGFASQNDAFVLSLLEWSGVIRSVVSSHDGVAEDIVIRLHENSNGFLLYVINQGFTEEQIKIRLSVPSDGDYQLEEILNGRTINVSSKGQKLEFETEAIAASEVKIYRGSRLP